MIRHSLVFSRFSNLSQYNSALLEDQREGMNVDASNPNNKVFLSKAVNSF